MAVNFPVRSFYSKNTTKRARELEEKLERSELELKKKPPPPDLRSSLLGHCVDWKVFMKLDEALKYASEARSGLGLMTFAFEEKVPGSEGRRKYMVTHPISMWKIHVARPAAERCTYEVIPQNGMCKLYFDLEFNKTNNPEANGQEMVETLLQSSFFAFKEMYNINVTEDDVLILDATTPTKFSQHLIYLVPGCAFQNNIHAGNFVRHIVSLLKEKTVPELDEEQMEKLFIKNDKGDLTCFCDLAVYNKNRNFRMFLSSKFGKNAPLIVASNNKHKPKLNDDDNEWPGSDAAFFSASLITYFRPDDLPSRILTCDSTSDKSYSGKSRTCEPSDPSLNGYTASPWSEIDRFISELVAPNGRIKHWVYYERTETIVYHIVGTRHCASIGREHKSNNIKYVVNIPNGTYYQSCFDPDCAQSRPAPEAIPPNCLPWANLADDPDLSL